MDKTAYEDFCTVPTEESLSDLLFNVKFYCDAFRVFAHYC